MLDVLAERASPGFADRDGSSARVIRIGSLSVVSARGTPLPMAQTMLLETFVAGRKRRSLHLRRLPAERSSIDKRFMFMI